jgi:hypothetical protein
MDRTDFYKIVAVDGINEFDYLNNSLSEFKTEYPVRYYRLTSSDVMRPDLISWQFYQTVDFWWLVCYVNKIINPLRDLVPGQVIIIPNIMDIFNFRKKWLVSRQ